MKEEDKRAVALNSLTSIGKEYVTLSDSTTIGKDVLKDLKKLMELELREKYKVNKTKWRVITKPKMKEGEQSVLSDAYDVITGNEKFMTELEKKFDENKNKIKKKFEKIEELKAGNKTDTDKYKRVKKELKELEKFFVIDMVPDIPISFNTIVKLRGKNAIVFVGEGIEEQPAYCVPYIEINKDPKEIATILNDKKELDKIFREKKFKSFDDMVILDFYNEITKKLSDTKDYLRKTDPDIRQDIIDDLYNKLFALYDIKEYYFKNKETDKEEIKEKYIKEKIRKNNNLSIGGGARLNAAINLLNPNKSTTKDLLKLATSRKDTDGRIKRAAKSLVVAPAAASVGATVDAAKLATLGTYKTLKGVTTGIYNGSKAAYKGVEYVQDKAPNIFKKPVDMYEKYQRKKLEKAEKFLEADKFLRIVSNLKDKSVDEIDNALNIKTLKELSDDLNDNSIYKKNIEELIDIHDSLLSSNRDTLLAEQEQEADEYIKQKKEASGEFVLEAVQKYKDLKKSFVDKVNKDKDDIEKMLEEGAGDDFAEEISFEDIVNNNSGTYIKKLKKLNSFLYMLNKKGGKYMDGGAAPMYDVQKLKKDDGDQESSGNTPFDYYRKLKDNYIEIINLYYKLINDIGGEEKHYKFIYEYESLGIKSPDEDDKIEISNEKKLSGEEELKKVYDYINRKLEGIISGNLKLFIREGHLREDDDEIIQKYASATGVKEALSKDTINPKGKITLQLRDELKKGDRVNFVRWEAHGSTGNSDAQKAINRFFSDLDSSLNQIQNCYKADDTIETPCNIYTRIQEIFNSEKRTDEIQGKINELEAKIQLVKNRIELLNELITKLPIELQKIYKTTKDMKGQAQATEYEEHVINILKRDKIEFFEKDKDKDKHPIIKQLNNELALRKQQLEKFQRQLNQAEKEKVYKLEKLKAEQKAGPGIYLAQGERGERGDGGVRYPSDSSFSLFGGASIKKDSNTKKYEEDLGLSSNELKNKHKSFGNLISDDKNQLNLNNLMKNLKNDIEYLENNDEANQDLDKSIDVGRDRGIYEDIWYDYNLGVNKKDNKTDKWKNYLLYLTEGEKVHDRVIQNNLDPEIVLKINFRDKSIYIFLMFLIRTINIIVLEFLIEYNIIKSLQYTIMLYGFMYLFIILLLVILVNYDSYKLRILFNYLNIHINSSNLLLQNVLFIIFIILVYILVKSDDFLKYFGDLFDFTNIYNNIYKFNESLNEDSDINLTQNEKLKLLYRIDIISMIIFIFSAFLVLIL